MERWEWIKGYEGLYQISDHGNFKSFVKNKRGRVVKLHNATGWYLSCTLRKDNKSKTKRIHVAVAETFIGSIPKGYHVHHKDGNKQNNHVDNLEIIHPSQHALENIKLAPNKIKGMNNYNRYIRPRRITMLTDDGNFIATFANAKIASQMTGVCQRNILQVAEKEPYGKNNRTRKQAGGYLWEIESEVILDDYVENDSDRQ